LWNIGLQCGELGHGMHDIHDSHKKKSQAVGTLKWCRINYKENNELLKVFTLESLKVFTLQSRWEECFKLDTYHTGLRSRWGGGGLEDWQHGWGRVILGG